MHTNRYLVHTLKNTPALIRYQLRALTSLVGRHSGRESGFDGWNYSRKIIHSPQIWVQYFFTVCCYATCHHAVRESYCDNAYKVRWGLTYRVYHPLTKVWCDVLLQQVQSHRFLNTARRKGVSVRTAFLFFATVHHIAFWWQGYADIFHSVCFPAFDVLHNSVRMSA